MKVIIKLFSLLLSLANRVFGIVWSLILFVVYVIDGGDEEEDDFSDTDTINYNYRTGELDPVKRIDGEYGNR